MPGKPGHRRFGNIRKRESGRYQVRYLGPDGRMRSAPQTFARKEEAERYLTLVESQMMKGEWIDPARSAVTLADYGDRWIQQRPGLRPRTVELYEQLFRTHIKPYLGGYSLGRLTTPAVREWRSELLDNGVSQSVAAKAYRLLRAILNTAMREDELIRVNPCRIPRADQEKTPERPALSVPQVFQLADLMPHKRYRALILTTTFACLRWGEVTALRRSDVDLAAGTVRVERAYGEQRGRGLVLGPPKSRAAVRIVSMPGPVVAELARHLAEDVPADSSALVFSGPSKARPPLRRNNFRKLVNWGEAVEKVGVPNLHFHDLRHTGNTLASRTGASTRDLMARMGHDSPRAALIYQHTNSAADQAIAQALSTELASYSLATHVSDHRS